MNTDQKPALIPLAYALIAAGLAVLAFVLFEAYGAYTDLASNRFASELMEHVTGKPLVVGPNTPFVLGEGGARLASVFLLFMLGSLGVAAGLGLIKAGVHVLTPRFEHQLSDLRQRVEELMSQVRR